MMLVAYGFCSDGRRLRLDFVRSHGEPESPGKVCFKASTDRDFKEAIYV